MKQKRNIPLTVFTAAIALFLLVGAIFNITLSFRPMQHLLGGNTDFKGFVSEFQEAYLDDLKGKEAYINLNGLFARATGRVTYNGVSLLANGMLDYDKLVKLDMTAYAEGLIDFDSYLKEKDIPFLYVQAPCKADLANTLIRPGVTNYGNENANALLHLLRGGNVKTLDLREFLTSTVEQVETYFYNTDHHWNTYGAFEGFGKILAAIDAQFPTAGVNLQLADASMWESTVYEDWFLGSRGKRVGIYYGGVDDLTVMKPKFETEMSMYVQHHRAYTSGDFESAVMKPVYLKAPDYFNHNAYCVYIGGDYPLVHHVNLQAENDLKVLLIKDSFTLPVQAFLSTGVRELDVLDPRHYSQTSIAEYVSLSEPDMVIMMVNPSLLGSKKYYQTGTEQAKALDALTSESNVRTEATFTVPYREWSNHNYKTFSTLPTDGAYYTLRFDDVEILHGDAGQVTALLYDVKKDTVYSSYVFDLEKGEEDGGFSWSFRVPSEAEGELELYLYAGRHGDTAGNEITYQNISLLKRSAA